MARSVTWLLLLLGCVFLTVSLHDAQVHAEVGPSESECRPYIEKAINDLKSGDSGAVDEDDDGVDSTENAAIEETSNEANDDGDDDNNDDNVTQEDDGQSQEDAQVAPEDEDSGENDETVTKSGEDDDDDAPKSGEDDDTPKSGEDDEVTASDENQEDDGSQEGGDNDDDDEKTATENDDDDGQDSTEAEGDQPGDSQEDDNGTDTDDTDDNDDDGQNSKEDDGENSQEATEDTPEDSAEKTASAEDDGPEDADDDDAQSQEADEEEVDKQSEEVLSRGKRSLDEDDDDQTDSKEVQEDDDGDSGEAAEGEDGQDDGDEESQEVDATPDDGEDSKEKDTDDADDTDDDEDSQEVATPDEDDDGEDSQEAKAAVEDDDEDSQEKDTDDTEDSKEAETTPEDGEDSQEKETDDNEDSKEAEATQDDGEDSQEKETDDTEDSKEAEATEDAADSQEEDAEQDEEDDAQQDDDDGDDSEENPEEELTLESEIPDNRRSREHIAELLHLDDDSELSESAIVRVADVILKDLKRIYENAIKPLETLYKYRDLSNRHFGDPEIFSKPLVVFMGPWSGGKSTLINYLTDNEYTDNSLRTGAEPSPAYFNILMYGEKPEVLDGTQLAADWTFSGLQKFGQGLEDRLRGLKLPSKLLEKVNIVEIPGILEVRKQVSRLFPFNDACQWFIDRADITFLVYDPSKLDVGPETEAILDQLKGREYQTRIILNKADQVKPEELMRVQSALIWNISPLMSSAQPPVMYTTSLWSLPFESGAPVRLLQAQERALLRDLRTAIDKRIENKIASARRFAVRVRNHAKMVDCYLTTYYNHKSLFGNRKQISDQIIEHPQNYHIYEGLSTLTNISRYDLPDPEVYRDFFRLNPLYEFKKLSETCTYFRGCPINKLDISIAYDLPELGGKYKKLLETALQQLEKEADSKESTGKS